MIYNAIQDKVYNKAKALKKSIRELNGGTGPTVDLPDGWKTRNGPRSTGRASVADLAAIFTGS